MRSFSEQFKTLGLVVNTGQFVNGLVTIGHIKSKRDELGEQLGAVLEEGSMSSRMLRA